VTFTATVSSKGTPTGSVYFLLNGDTLGLEPLIGGTGTITTNISSIGAYMLTAQYLGDAENSGSNSGAITEVSLARLP
jgi:hypothetical protein